MKAGTAEKVVLQAGQSTFPVVLRRQVRRIGRSGTVQTQIAMVESRRVMGDQFGIAQLMHFRCESLVQHCLIQFGVQLVQMIRVRTQNGRIVFVIGVRPARAGTAYAQIRCVRYAKHATAAARCITSAQVQGHRTAETVVPLIRSSRSMCRSAVQIYARSACA